MSDYQTLRDIAAKRKWVFKPDDNYPVEAKAGISGLVHFPNGFLRQAGKKGELVGRVYNLGVPLLDMCSLEEIQILKGDTCTDYEDLPDVSWNVNFTAGVGRLQANFIVTTASDAAINAIVKLLNYAPQTRTGVLVALTHNRPQFPPLRSGEGAKEYARRNNLPLSEVLAHLDAIPK